MSHKSSLRGSAPTVLGSFLALLSVVVLVVCLLPEPSSATDSASAITVSAGYGLIEGYLVPNTTNRQIYKFLGIPYAQPPVGSLRWQPPVPCQASKRCWKSVLRAQAFGNHCIQPEGDGSEDCLFLNIWTPAFQYNKPLPVLFYIHGGGLNQGNGEINGAPMVDGSSRPVVLVTINYRLNGFGFMALNILSKNDVRGVSGNYGIMDMMTALQWVRDNIAAFGGDPNRITISGQSSGGTGVLAMMISPRAKGLFQRAILMSASTRIDYTLAQAEQQNLIFLNKTNCLNQKPVWGHPVNTPLSCLYGLSTQEVLDALPWDEFPFWGHDDDYSIPIPSRGDGAVLCIIDGYVITDSAVNVLSGNSTTKPNDVPAIFGSMAQENDAGPGADLTGYTSKQYSSFITQSFSVFSPSLPAKVLALYPLANFNNDPQLAYESITADIRVTCGQNLLSRLAASTFKSPIYRYVVVQKPTAPVYLDEAPPAGWGSRNSFHLFDVFTFFNKYYEVAPQPAGYEYAPNENDKLFAYLLRDFFTELVTNGNINSPLWPPMKTSSPDTYNTALLQLPLSYVTNWRKAQCQLWQDNGLNYYAWNS